MKSQKMQVAFVLEHSTEPKENTAKPDRYSTWLRSLVHGADEM